MRRSSESSWSWSTVLFVAVTAAIGTLVSHYVNVFADRIDSRFGYRPDPAGTAEFLSELEKPRFAQAGEDCMKNAVKQDTFLYRFVNEAHERVYGKPFESWNQGSIGTCVSMGFGLGSYTGQCVDWSQGELPAPPKVVATEPIYAGSRTLARLPPVTFAGFSDGSYGGAAARWISGKCRDPAVGGIVYREVVGKYDLTRYSIELSKNWGAYGPPREIAVAAAKHRAVAVAQVRTWEELTAAIGSGYAVAICSDVGFAATKVRDKDGFLPRGGNWSHCMLVWATRFAGGPGGNRDGALIQNSWGPRWVTGPKYPADQPDGSFWCSRADIEAILRQGDSFAIGGVEGFPFRKLEHREWMQPPPPQVSRQPVRVNHALAL